MDAVYLILHIGAAISFGLAVANTPTRINTVALGLLLWVLVPLLALIQTLN